MCKRCSEFCCHCQYLSNLAVGLVGANVVDPKGDAVFPDYLWGISTTYLPRPIGALPRAHKLYPPFGSVYYLNLIGLVTV